MSFEKIDVYPSRTTEVLVAPFCRAEIRIKMTKMLNSSFKRMVMQLWRSRALEKLISCFQGTLDMVNAASTVRYSFNISYRGHFICQNKAIYSRQQGERIAWQCSTADCYESKAVLNAFAVFY